MRRQRRRTNQLRRERRRMNQLRRQRRRTNQLGRQRRRRTTFGPATCCHFKYPAVTEQVASTFLAISSFPAASL